jgi:hypothetical protein
VSRAPLPSSPTNIIEIESPASLPSTWRVPLQCNVLVNHQSPSWSTSIALGLLTSGPRPHTRHRRWFSAGQIDNPFPVYRRTAVSESGAVPHTRAHQDEDGSLIRQNTDGYDGSQAVITPSPPNAPNLRRGRRRGRGRGPQYTQADVLREAARYEAIIATNRRRPSQVRTTVIIDAWVNRSNDGIVDSTFVETLANRGGNFRNGRLNEDFWNGDDEAPRFPLGRPRLHIDTASQAEERRRNLDFRFLNMNRATPGQKAWADPQIRKRILSYMDYTAAASMCRASLQTYKEVVHIITTPVSLSKLKNMVMRHDPD